ncbi:hypothetical protein WJX82_003357 [Trebouxia sp. C0006]
MQYDLTRVALGSVCKLKPQAGRSQQLPPYCSPRHPTALFTQCSIRSLIAVTSADTRRCQCIVVKGNKNGNRVSTQAQSTMQGGPINFEAFRWHQALAGDPDRRLYVLHAHIYFLYSTEDDKAKASKFRAEVQARFAESVGVKISDISPEALAPHPMPQFEIAFTKCCLQDIAPWLIFSRPDDYSILVHPFTSDVVADHDASAMWLGKNLGADLTPLIDLQRKIADQVQAGADEASLLWPFVYAEINSQSALI